MKIKKRILIPLIVLLAVLLIPLPLRLKDGGTVTYNAVLYRVVVWHALNEADVGGYKTGVEVHIFPKNLKPL